MAKPVKPKAIKPKADDAAAGAGGSPGGAPKGGGLNLQFLMLMLAIMLSSTLGPSLALYFLGPMVLVPAITAHLPAAEGEHGKQEEGHGGEGDEHGGGIHKQLGMSLPLEDFTVNLRQDPTTGARRAQYLRTRMSLSLQVPEEQDCSHAAAGDHGGGGGGGGHGGGAAVDPVAACQTAFEGQMKQYMPTIRDIINTSLMKRTAAEVASLEGQEALKDEVIREVNLVMGPEGYRVQRVNLQDFIIQ